jgi:hypothetical protein
MARADLGYIAGSLSQSHLVAMCGYPYAVLVAYEADLFLTRYLDHEPRLEGSPTATAARMASKIYEDTKVSVEDIAGELTKLAQENDDYFRGGPNRELARELGIYNPDLPVFMLKGRPLVNGSVLLFQLGFHAVGLEDFKALGPLAYDLAVRIGLLAGGLGIEVGQHKGDGSAVHDVTSLDAVGADYNSHAFGGGREPLDVLLLSLLHNNAAVGARLGQSRCCESCASAAAKQKFLSGYQVARSLDAAHQSHLLSQPCRERLAAVSSSPAAEFFRRYRPLRNSLVHLGLNGRPAEVIDAPDPTRALIEHDLESGFSDAVQSIHDAAASLDDQLTGWLLQDSDALLQTLREPEDE